MRPFKKLRTSCRRGHLYTESSVWWKVDKKYGFKYRQCKHCAAYTERLLYHKRKQENESLKKEAPWRGDGCQPQ